MEGRRGLRLLMGAGRDPSVGYADLHEQGSVLPNDMMWMVVGYDAASQVLRDHTHFSSEITMGGFDGGGMGNFGKTMVFVDPPDHTRLRSVVAKPFTPRALASWEPRIREIARDLLDAIEPGGTFDIMSGLARPLPVIVIAEMLGLDTSKLDSRQWSDPNVGMVQMMSMTAGESRESMFADAIAERREQPRDDLISLLVQAQQDGQIDEAELLGSCALLFIAGNVTTTSLLGNTVYALSRHPEQCDVLAGDASKIPNALEEVFRYDPPVPAIPPRRAISATTVDGHDVAENTNIVVYAAAANRDPKRFADAETFDITRPDAASHLALGAGIHYCLGAPLSRLESRVAMEELLERVPRLRLAEGAEVHYDGSSFLRAPRTMPIAV